MLLLGHTPWDTEREFTAYLDLDLDLDLVLDLYLDLYLDLDNVVILAGL